MEADEQIVRAGSRLHEGLHRLTTLFSVLCSKRFVWYINGEYKLTLKA